MQSLFVVFLSALSCTILSSASLMTNYLVKVQPELSFERCFVQESSVLFSSSLPPGDLQQYLVSFYLSYMLHNISY